MQGQWWGDFTADQDHSTDGLFVMNLDRRGNRFVGRAYLFEEKTGGYGSVFAVEVWREGEAVQGKGTLVGVTDPKANLVINVEEGKKFVAHNWSFPGTMDFSGNVVDPNRIALKWSTANGTSGDALARRTPHDSPSALKRNPVSWADFKKLVGANSNGLIFRGQSQPWPLRTAFHRAGRSDIHRFSTEDIGDLRRALTASLSFVFDISNPEHHTALMAIAQHHGYPTPLLDWTTSPYVAAYFACRDCHFGQQPKPRIFALNPHLLERHAKPVRDISAPVLTMQRLEPMLLFNPRVVPQQSVVTFCNSDDVESWLNTFEQNAGAQILTVYDLTDDPRTILRELGLMGIHAGSMFPGLDGVCRSLTERNFLQSLPE